MPTKGKIMVINRVLDNIFNSWAHPPVIRSLLDSTTGYTGREVARLAGIHPHTALKTLANLEDLNIVKRQRGGRDHIFTLNRENYLVYEVILPLFQKEQQFRNEVYKALSKILKGKVASAVVFGSTARKEERPSSDLDICCIIEKKQAIENVRNLLNNSSQKLYKKYGIRVSPVFFTIAEFKKKKNTQLIHNIIEEGKEITGSLKRVIADG